MRRKGLRTGYTTGSCAAAAAKAAAAALIGQWDIRSIDITLPGKEARNFAIERCIWDGGKASCRVIKDAGDDPDVTHGADICATVSWSDAPGITIVGGSGVGTVTKLGLGLPIGEAAINPIPRRMILDSVEEALGLELTQQGLRVEISVPNGEEIAKKTLNQRLGIVGGVSILGTTGIVIPYSTKAFKASIRQALGVAQANGCREVILVSGRRSEKFAQEFLSLREEAFIEVGDYVDYSLGECVKKRLEKATLWGMVGKMAKIAQGQLFTHSKSSAVEPEFLAGLAQYCGAEDEAVDQIKRVGSARQFLEIALESNLSEVCGMICQLGARNCFARVKEKIAIECILSDFEGKVLGRASVG